MCICSARNRAQLNSRSAYEQHTRPLPSPVLSCSEFHFWGSRRAGLAVRDNPIIRRKIDLPEAGGGPEKLNSHLRLVTLGIAQIHDPAFKRLARRLIGDRNLLAGGDWRVQRNQSPVCVHHQRARIFAEILTSRCSTMHKDRHAQKHAHTSPAAVIEEPVLFFGMGRDWCGHS